MKKRICVLLILVLAVVGLASCGDPYDKVSMTVDKTEFTLTLREENNTVVSSGNERLTVKVDVPSSLSSDIVLPKFGDRYGNEYVSITMDDNGKGEYSLSFTGLKAGYTEIPIKTQDGNVTEVIKITIQLAVTDIEFKEHAEVLMEENSSLNLNELPVRNYIDYFPSATDQTAVTYYLLRDDNIDLKTALETKWKGEDVETKWGEYCNNFNGAIDLKDIVFCEKADGNEPEIKVGAMSNYGNNIGTSNVLTITVIKPFDIGYKEENGVKGSNVTANIVYDGAEPAQIYPTGVNANKTGVYFTLELANPNVPQNEGVTIEEKKISHIFGGRLRFTIGTQKYKIALANSDQTSTIADISFEKSELVDGVSKARNYYYQFMPKDLGGETFTFKIDYVGGADTNKYDGLFTKYIYLTIKVKDLPTASNLLINNKKYDPNEKVMVFVDKDKEIEVFEPNAKDMEYSIVTKNCSVTKVDGSAIAKELPNGSSFLVKVSETGANPIITITMKTYFVYDENGAPSGTFSKIVDIELYVISTDSSLVCEDKQIIIDGSEDLNPAEIANYSDENVDISQIVKEYSLSNLRSGKVTFGTGADKNKIFFTPNFKLEYDFYVSDTVVTFLLEDGSTKTMNIDLELNYVSRDTQPVIWVDYDTENKGFLAGYYMQEEGDGFELSGKFDQTKKTEEYANGNTTIIYPYINRLILATNTTIKFNVYRLCLYDGRRVAVSSNDSLTATITAKTGVRWNNIDGDGVLSTKNITSNEAETCSISFKVGETVVYTLKVYVYEKISGVGLKQSSYVLYDGRKLNDADISSSYAVVDFNVTETGGKSNDGGYDKYGNFYDNFELNGKDDVILSYNTSSGNNITLVNVCRYQLVAGSDEDGLKYVKLTKVFDKDKEIYYYKNGDKWYNSAIDAYNGVNEIEKPFSKEPAGVTVVVFQFKFTSDGENVDEDKLASMIYENGYVDLVFVGNVKQFNQEFDKCNFVVRLYNPARVSSVKTNVNKDNGIYFETGNQSRQTNSFKYNILPSSAFNKNVFVSIRKMNESGGKVDYLEENVYYKVGEDQYVSYEKDNGDYTTGLIGITNYIKGKSTTIKKKADIESGFFVTLTPNGTSGVVKIETVKINAGKYECNVVAIDSFNSKSNDVICDTFTMYVADGAQDNPFQIRNRADFLEFLKNTNNNTSPHYYVLASDIVLTGAINNPNYKLNDNLSGKFKSVSGSQTTEYKYVIYGLNIISNGNTPVGLFGSIGRDGLTIEYINIENANVSVTTEADVNVGILFGTIDNGINIKNCKVSGNIKVVENESGKTLNVGGFAGEMEANATISGVPSESSINNSNINSNVVIEVVSDKNSVIISAGGLLGQVSNGLIEKTNIITQIYARNSSNSFISANIGGAVGYVKSANLNEVVVYPIIAGLSQVGGLAGKVENGEFVNCQVQLLYNANMKNIVAGFDKVGGLIGDITTSNNLTLDYCYVRSYSNLTPEQYGVDGDHTAIFNNMKNKYYGGVVLINNNTSQTSQSLGGLVGNVSKSSTATTDVTFTISNSYFSSDLTSSATNESIGGFVGKTENVNLVVKDSYIDGDVVVNNYDNFKVISGSNTLASDTSTPTGTPVTTYKFLGDTTLQEAGNYAILTETSTSSAIVTYSETGSMTVDQFYCKINNENFGVINRDSNKITYGKNSVTKTETNILVYRDDENYIVSAFKKMLNNNTVDYYIPGGYDDNIDINGMTNNAIRDILGYGFATYSDMTSGQEVINFKAKTVEKEDNLTVGTTDDWKNALNELLYSTGNKSSLGECINAIVFNKDYDRVNADRVIYNKTIETTTEGSYDADRQHNKFYSFTYDQKTYYIKHNEPKQLYSTLSKNSVTGATTLGKPWVFVQPKMTTEEIKLDDGTSCAFKYELENTEGINVVIDGKTITSACAFFEGNGMVEGTKCRVVLYSEDSVAYIVDGTWKVDYTGNESVIRLSENEAILVDTTNAKRVYDPSYSEDSNGIVYSITYCDAKGKVIVQDSESSVIGGETQITIEGITYRLENGGLINTANDQEISSDISGYYIINALTLSEELTAMSETKMVEIYNVINGKEANSLEEVFDDADFNYFDGEVKAYFGRIEYLYMQQVENGDGSKTNTFYKTISVSGTEVADEDTIGELNKLTTSETGGIIRVEYENNYYFKHGEKWYSSISGITGEDEVTPSGRISEIFTIYKSTDEKTSWQYVQYISRSILSLTVTKDKDSGEWEVKDNPVTDDYLKSVLENEEDEYELILYKTPRVDANGNPIWSYDNGYINEVNDANIKNLINGEDKLNVSFSFVAEGTNGGETNIIVTIEDGEIELNSNALGDANLRIENNRLYVSYSDGKKEDYALTSSDSSYKWVVTNKVNNKLPVIVRPYIDYSNNKYSAGYQLWYDTLANISIMVNDFKSAYSDKYYCVDANNIEHQGHIVEDENTVVLMYNQPIDGTESDENINKYRMSYGYSESGYFIASLNGQVMELTALRIDKDTASQIVVTSSNPSIAEISADQNLDNNMQIIVKNTGDVKFTFYNLKDDSLHVDLNVKIIRGFTDFVICKDGESESSDTISLKVGTDEDFNIGFVNRLNNIEYRANTSGYQILVNNVDGGNITQNSSSILINGVKLDSNSIGSTFVFEHTNVANILAVNKNDDGNGMISLTITPFVIVGENRILIEKLTKDVTINISAPANAVEFTETETRLLAQNTKRITLAVSSNNGNMVQTIKINVSGGDFENSVEISLDSNKVGFTNLVDSEKLLSVKLVKYEFIESQNVSGQALIHKHLFVLEVGLNVDYYLEEYGNGTNVFTKDFNYIFKAYDNELSSEFRLTLTPSEVDRIDTYFYPIEVGYKDSYQQISIMTVASGRSGIYKIELSPEFNNVLAVDLIVDGRFADYVELTQVVPYKISNAEISDDEKTDNLVVKYNKLATPTTYIGNKLTLWNALIDYSELNASNSTASTEPSGATGSTEPSGATGSTEPSGATEITGSNLLKTQGEYYVQIFFKETMPEKVDFSLDIQLYDYQRNVILSKSDTIYIDPKPTIKITSEGLDRVVLAKNEYVPIEIVAEDITSKISASVKSLTAGSRDCLNFYTRNTRGEYEKVDIYSDEARIDLNKQYYIMASSDCVCGMYNIKVEGFKEINGNIYSAESTLAVTVAEFTIKEISEIDAETGTLVIKQATSHKMKAKITTNNAYDDSSKKLLEDLVLEISSFYTRIDGTNISNWYVLKNGQWDAISIKPGDATTVYDVFAGRKGAEKTVEEIEYDRVVLEARILGTAQLKLSVHYYYDKDGKINIDWDNNTYVTDKEDGYTYPVDIIEFPFTLLVEDNSSEDHPNPLYNQEDLAKLAIEGGSYILQDNIDLVSWAPIDFKADMLDGNGYTIRIMSFDLSKEKGSSEAKVGVFRTISETSIVKNLNINIFPLLRSKNMADRMKDGSSVPNIDLRETEQVSFGVLAGENSGVVENVKIVNCSTEDNLVLYVATTRGGYQIGDDYQTTTSYIGAIVGQNNGVIADSMAGTRKSHTVKASSGSGAGTTTGDTKSASITINYVTISPFSLWGGNNLGGFVAVNSGTISNCFVSDLSITNTTRVSTNAFTAGFVGQNSGKVYSCAVTSNELDKYRAKNTVINSYATTGGFAHKNTGTIEDCYTNAQLSTSTTSAGFVYENEGSIANTYTTTRNKEIGNSYSSAFGLYVYVKPMKGTLLNCYYAIIDDEYKLGKDISVEVLRTLDPAIGLNIAYSTDTLSKGSFNGFTFDSGQSSVDGVWDLKIGEMPTLINCEETELFSVRALNSEKNGVFNYQYNNGYHPGSINNPLMVSSAEEFNKYIVTNAQMYNNGTLLFGGTSNDSNSSIARYVKIVQDLDFSDKTILTKHKYSGGGENDKKSIADVTFNGVLMGNSMKLSNIYLTREEKDESENWGIFSQIGYAESDAKAFVFNLKLNYREVSSENSNRVGVLAGTIENANIVKIDIEGPSNATEKDIVKGKYFVGGLAGYVGENVRLSEINVSNVNVSAGYVTKNGDSSFNLTSAYVPEDSSYRKFSYKDPVSESTTNIELTEDIMQWKGKDEDGNVVVVYNISYAGAVAGVLIGKTENATIDNYRLYKENNNEPTYYAVRNLASIQIQNITAKNDIGVSGMVAGGLFGYAGGSQNTLVVKDTYFELNDKATQTIAGRAYSGGIVGYSNNLALVESRVEHELAVQDTIDNSINTITSNMVSNNNLFVSDVTSENSRTLAIGGIIGYSYDSIIIDSYSKVNVVNTSSYIAGGLVGQADKALYMAYCYTIGNVDASLMAGGLVGYKLYSNSKQDLYMFNCIGANVWSDSIFATISTNAERFGNNATYKSTIQEIGNYNYGGLFNDITSTNSFKYLGSVIGRASVLSTESLSANISGTTSAVNLFGDLNKITRTNTVTAGSNTINEDYYTYYNSNFFHVVSSTYGRISHSGNMSLDNYTSYINGNKLLPNTNTKIGNQYYIGYITGDFVNSAPIKEGENYIPSNYKNEFSYLVGFTYDIKDAIKNDASKIYSDLQSKITNASTVWYVDSNTYLPKHGFNRYSNVEEIKNGDALKTALTFGYSDKVYKLNGYEENGTTSFNTYTLSVANNQDINLSNCAFIYNGDGKFTLTINISKSTHFDGLYNILSGCSFTNFKIIINYNSATLNGTSNSSGYSGLFANELLGVTFTNCDIEINTSATLSLGETITTFGLFAGRANRVVMTDSTFTLNNAVSIANQNENAFANIGGVFGVLRTSTLSNVTVNMKDLTFGEIKTNNSYLFMGGLAGQVDGGNYNEITPNGNYTLNTAVSTSATLLETKGGLLIGGVFGSIKDAIISELQTDTITIGKPTVAVTDDKKIETLKIGGVIGHLTSTRVSGVDTKVTLNADTYDKVNSLYIGGFAGVGKSGEALVDSKISVSVELKYSATIKENIGIGGVLGLSNGASLSGVQSAVALTITGDNEKLCGNLLTAGGLTGNSSGDMTIENSYSVGDITIERFLNKVRVGGIVGSTSGNISMENVISYGDIIYVDQGTVTRHNYNGRYYYIKDDNVYVDENCQNTLISQLQLVSNDELKKNNNSRVGYKVNYSGTTFYYSSTAEIVDNRGITDISKLYISYSNGQFSNPVSDWTKESMPTNNFNFGGIIGNVASSSSRTFTNVLSMTNIIGKYKTSTYSPVILENKHGFAYNLRTNSAIFDNSYFVSEFDPAGASDANWTNLAIPYVNLSKFVNDSNKKMEFYNVETTTYNYFPVITGMTEFVTNNAEIFATGKKLNPTVVTGRFGSVKSIDERNYVVVDYTTLKADADGNLVDSTASSSTPNITVGIGALLTSNKFDDNTSTQVQGNPIGKNNGVVSNFLFDHVGSSHTLSVSNDTYLGATTNNGYIYNCLFATGKYKATEDDKTYTTSGLKLTVNSAIKLAVIGTNNGGIYKSGSGIKYIDGSRVTEGMKLGMFVGVNNGAIKECYSIGSFEGDNAKLVDEGGNSVSITYSWIANTNNGNISNCLVGGLFVNNYIEKSKAVADNKGKLGSVWVSTNGTGSGINLDSLTSNIWETEITPDQNNGFPYIKDGKHFDYTDFGSAKVVIPTVQVFKNFLNYLNAYDLNGTINSIQSYQTVIFSIEKGTISEPFKLNNRGTVKGNIKDLNLPNALVDNNYGTIQDMTIESCKVDHTNTNSDISMLCNINSGKIQDIYVSKSTVGNKDTAYSKASIIACENTTGKSIGGIVLDGCHIYSYIEETESGNGDAYAGLVSAYQCGATKKCTKNLVDQEKNENLYEAVKEYDIYIKDCSVEGNFKNAGLMFGLTGEDSSYKPIKAKAIDSNIAVACGGVGGMIGGNKSSLSNVSMELDNVNVSLKNKFRSGSQNGTYVGGVIGITYGDSTDNTSYLGNITVTGGTVKTESIMQNDTYAVEMGGVIGACDYSTVKKIKGTISCSNTVHAAYKHTNYYIGGIVGYACPEITIDGCVTFTGKLDCSGYNEKLCEETTDGYTIVDERIKYLSIEKIFNGVEVANGYNNKNEIKHYALFSYNDLKVGWFSGSVLDNNPDKFNNPDAEVKNAIDKTIYILMLERLYTKDEHGHIGTDNDYIRFETVEYELNKSGYMGYGASNTEFHEVVDVKTEDGITNRIGSHINKTNTIRYNKNNLNNMWAWFAAKNAEGNYCNILQYEFGELGDHMIYFNWQYEYVRGDSNKLALDNFVDYDGIQTGYYEEREIYVYYQSGMFDSFIKHSKYVKTWIDLLNNTYIKEVKDAFHSSDIVSIVDGKYHESIHKIGVNAWMPFHDMSEYNEKLTSSLRWNDVLNTTIFYYTSK